MQKYIKYILVTIVILITVFSFAWGFVNMNYNQNSGSEQVVGSDIETIEGKFLKEGVNRGDILQGCSVRDCIPAINNPNFDTVEVSNDWLDGEDLIFGLSRNGITKGYPQRILNWHEIVNDEFGDDNIAITFCPLCGSAGAFNRDVNGETRDFGVSGKLLNSNLIMYDDVEDSFWQQATGEAIAGEAARRGDILEFIPIEAMTWDDWKNTFPDSKILTRETGYSRNYSQYPYGTYEEDDEIYFGIQNSDERLQVKTPGWGFEFEEDGEKINLFVQESRLQGLDTLQTEYGQIENNGSGIKLITNNGNQVASLRTFWFAFAAFFPDVIII